MIVMTLWQIFVSNVGFESLSFHTLMIMIIIFRIMLYINSAFNPMVYNLISTKFRGAFRDALSCEKNKLRIVGDDAALLGAPTLIVFQVFVKAEHLIFMHKMGSFLRPLARIWLLGDKETMSLHRNSFSCIRIVALFWINMAYFYDNDQINVMLVIDW